MELIADFLLAAGALASALYCYVLSRRLKRFNDLRDGMGGAVAVLSAQVDEMTTALMSAKTVAEDSTGSLRELTERAERAAVRLELTLAAMHDLPSEKSNAPSAPPGSGEQRPHESAAAINPGVEGGTSTYGRSPRQDRSEAAQ